MSTKSNEVVEGKLQSEVLLQVNKDWVLYRKGKTRLRKTTFCALRIAHYSTLIDHCIELKNKYPSIFKQLPK